METILIIDDDKGLCRTLEIQLQKEGFRALSSFTALEGLHKAETVRPDLVMLDINLPDESGLAVLPKFLATGATVVIMTGEPSNKLVIEAMRSGAFDYLRKPLALDDVLLLTNKVMHNRDIQGKRPGKTPYSGQEEFRLEIIGAHPKIVEIHKFIGLLARSRVTVLIDGESGTGKELAARILHDSSTPDQPFVAVNCSAVVPTLLESEFFGHEKGSFTGATRLKIGKLEYAAAGTVFLDEIGDMPLDLQAKLLRVLQEEEFVRVGGVQTIPLQARIVAATNKDLHKLVQEEKFREDLYYRLAVSSITLPPLRERMSDLPLMVDYLIAKINKKLGRSITEVDPAVLERLSSYDWPGNIRELENVMMRAVAFAKGNSLDADDLEMPNGSDRGPDKQERPVTLAQAEKIHITEVLREQGWNITRSARFLDISPTTLRKKIADYSLGNPQHEHE